jgi:hypothetical protein
MVVLLFTAKLSTLMVNETLKIQELIDKLPTIKPRLSDPAQVEKIITFLETQPLDILLSSGLLQACKVCSELTQKCMQSPYNKIVAMGLRLHGCLFDNYRQFM